MSNIKINGHAMSKLVVPKSHDSTALWEAVQPLIKYHALSFSNNGTCTAYGNRKAMISTAPEYGGTPLPKPYTGQSFILCVPTWALSTQGQHLASNFKKGNT